MKVVLTRDVKDLGRSGEVKEVSDGYARNYLFPRRLAVPATASVMERVEAQQRSAARRAEQEEQRARQIAERLEDQPVRIFPRVGEQGRLYGSVTAADVADALSKMIGEAVDKRRIELQESIRTLGEYRVPYRISRTVTTTLTVQVERAPARS